MLFSPEDLLTHNATYTDFFCLRRSELQTNKFVCDTNGKIGIKTQMKKAELEFLTQETSAYGIKMLCEWRTV